MAVLSENDRADALRDFVRRTFIELGHRADFDTVDLKAALDATDVWIDNNTGSYNTALPPPFKTSATVQQKTLLLTYVALKRAGVI